MHKNIHFGNYKMSQFKVYTAGFPREKTEIREQSPLDAALAFFEKNKFRNPIVVEWGFWNSEVIHFKDMKTVIHDLDETEYEYKPKVIHKGDVKKTPFWKEYLYRFFIQNRDPRI